MYKRQVYEMYYEFEEPVSKSAGHRILALNRGEKEKFLTVKVTAPVDEILRYLEKKIIVKDNPNTTCLLYTSLRNTAASAMQMVPAGYIYKTHKTRKPVSYTHLKFFLLSTVQSQNAVSCNLGNRFLKFIVHLIYLSLIHISVIRLSDCHKQL